MVRTASWDARRERRIMDRSIEVVRAAALAALARRQAGRPVWDERISLKGLLSNEELSFEEIRDGIVAILMTSRWFKQSDPDEFDGVHELISYHLAYAENEDEFNDRFEELYDHADTGAWRVWIEQ